MSDTPPLYTEMGQYGSQFGWSYYYFSDVPYDPPLPSKGPLWEDENPAAEVLEDTVGENQFGVVFAGEFSGVFDVDEVVDTLEEFDMVAEVDDSDDLRIV